MRSVHFLTLLALCGSLPACATSTGRQSAALAVMEERAAPIWVRTETPTPLPMVRMVPGETKVVPLAGAAREPGFRLTGAQTAEAIGCQVIMEPQAVTLRAEPGSKGSSVVLLDVELESGGTQRLAFPVSIEPVPIHEFTYKPSGSERRVFVAGSFNGWGGGADELIKGEDGVFRLRKAVPPGTHSYKFVVDGNWIADPGNPEQDASGYGNSMLRVEGEVERTFGFDFLSSAMPGSGPQGAFKAMTENGVLIDSSTVTVVVNNQHRERKDWEFDSKANIIRLQLPEGDWLKENYVSIVADTTDGARGQVTAPVAYADAPRTPRDEVIYFAMTDRFRDGEPSNNTPSNDPRVHPLADYHGGDFAGIREKIKDGYFQKLGVTSIWISPPNENTMKVEQESIPPQRYYTSYHGYWPTSSVNTNPAFGSMADLKDLVATAHENGITILIDFVSNHVHVDHPLLQERPGLATEYLLEDGTKNLRLFDEHPFTTWFDTFIPSLDYENNPDIIDIMTDNAIFWLKATNADGFRHDAVKHIPKNFWRDLTRKVNREIVGPQNRAVYQVGETISGHETITQFIGPDMMDGQFDFPTYWAILGAIGRGEGKMADIAGAIRDAERWYPVHSIMSPLIGNHDVSRFMGYADGDVREGMDAKELGFVNPPTVDSATSYRKLQLAYASLSGVPGPPTLYYGDEIGMTGAHDPDNRRSMSWEGLDEHQVDTFNVVSGINKARHESVAIRRGITQILHEDEERLVIARVAPEEVVLITLSRRPPSSSYTIELPSHWGTIKDVEELFARDQKASVEDGTITLTDGNYQFGVWRLKW